MNLGCVDLSINITLNWPKATRYEDFMKIQHRSISAMLSGIILLHLTTFATTALADTLDLRAATFEHIQFSKIKPNKHSYEKGSLKIEVDNSASFLMLPFDHVRKISKLSFDWRSEGKPQIKDAAQESARDGDDAVFKVGLLLRAEDDSLNPFLPSWMKRVKALLHFPSENMVDLVVDSKHAVGEQWTNPYNKRVLMVSIASEKGADGWWHTHYQSEQPLAVVAVWLMADGDNTDSKFTSYVKNISFE